MSTRFTLYHVYGGASGFDQQHQINIEKNQNAAKRIITRRTEVREKFKEAFGDDDDNLDERTKTLKKLIYEVYKAEFDGIRKHISRVEESASSHLSTIITAGLSGVIL